MVTLPQASDIPDEAFMPPATIEAPSGEQQNVRPPGQEPLPDNALEEAEPAPEAPPKTVVDMAKGTGENLKKAGDAVGNAAKKTWTCLSSFFSDC